MGLALYLILPVTLWWPQISPEAVLPIASSWPILGWNGPSIVLREMLPIASKWPSIMPSNWPSTCWTTYCWWSYGGPESAQTCDIDDMGFGPLPNTASNLVMAPNFPQGSATNSFQVGLHWKWTALVNELKLAWQSVRHCAQALT